jgi:NADPH:quinone reductase-like Zn-dependent oxidoreductase
MIRPPGDEKGSRRSGKFAWPFGGIVADERSADRVMATDDENAMDNLPPLEAVADAVDGRTAEKLISKVKPGGMFASVLGPPENAEKYPSVKVAPVFATPSVKVLQFMAEAFRDGKLHIPISRKFPLSDAGEAQAVAEEGTSGKVLLVA